MTHETPPTKPTQEELKEAEKEMHMSGRAIRVNETLEEFRKERKESWDNKTTEKSEAEKNLMPSKYKGLPAGLLEEIWIPRSAEEIQNKKIALEQLKIREAGREKKKEELIAKRYAALPQDRRVEFPVAQEGVVGEILKHIANKEDVSLPLTKEEEFLLVKTRADYQKHQEQKKDQPFAVQLNDEIDQKVYYNLVNRMAFEALDHKAANQAREKIGIPTQELGERLGGKKGLKKEEVLTDTVEDKEKGVDLKNMNQR